MMMMTRGSGDGGDIQDRGGTNSNFLLAGTHCSKQHGYRGDDFDDDDLDRSQVTHTSGVKCQ